MTIGTKQETCVICESGTAVERIRDRRRSIGEKDILIKDERYMHCQACGEEYYTGQQARNVQEKVLALTTDGT